MEFLEIPLIDDDILKLLVRFSINNIFLTYIIWFKYYKQTKRHDYLFTYYLVSNIAFLLCFTLKKFEMDIGMALGLFAIFGIIRYRTDSIEIKEMTYLFVVIGISVINALANKNMSYAEILTGNMLIVAAVSLLESFRIFKSLVYKDVLYEKIENIQPKNRHLLKADLQQRLGVRVNRVCIKNVDFLKDTAKLTVFYSEDRV